MYCNKTNKRLTVYIIYSGSKIHNLSYPTASLALWQDEYLLIIFYEIINPFAPGDFAEKKCFEASRVVSWSLSCYKELKLTTNRFTGCTLQGLLIQMQNISLRSLGMRRKQNFEIVFRFKSDTAVLTFTFRFLSSPLFSLFLPHFFFLLLGIKASFWWE